MDTKNVKIDIIQNNEEKVQVMKRKNKNYNFVN